MAEVPVWPYVSSTRSSCCRSLAVPTLRITEKILPTADVFLEDNLNEWVRLVAERLIAEKAVERVSLR